MREYRMVFRLFITRLLAILIVAGLAVAPVAAPAAMQASIMHASMAAEMTEMSVADVSSMAADMPCCPDEQKSKTCTDCPVIAMCVLTTAQVAPPETSALPVRHAVRTTHALRDDAFADGLDRPPPDQPPRNLA
jgi:hypothetical protein